MRRLESGFAVLVALLCGVMLISCSEPTKPIKKLNIKRASDFEPITSSAVTDTVVENAATPPPEQAAPAEELEIIDVQGFRGECDSLFVGINDDGFVTMRSAAQVRTYKLAGILIPESVRAEAHNQVRIWLDKKGVSVEVDDSVPAIDPSAYLYTCPEGKMVNEELVRAGLAMPSETNVRRTDVLKKASVEALTSRRGVWGQGTQ